MIIEGRHCLIKRFQDGTIISFWNKEQLKKKKPDGIGERRKRKRNNEKITEKRKTVKAGNNGNEKGRWNEINRGNNTDHKNDSERRKHWGEKIKRRKLKRRTHTEEKLGDWKVYDRRRDRNEVYLGTYSETS